MTQHIEPLEVVQLVEDYVNQELSQAATATNREPLDDSGIWSLHALAARIYAAGYADGGTVFAYGHINPSVFVGAVAAFDHENADLDEPHTVEDVLHTWAVTERPADDPDGWYVRWHQPEDAPEAFPMTVIVR